MTGHEARVAAVLDHLRRPDAPLLGRGSEGWVYGLNDAEVVKVYIAGSQAYLEALASLHMRIAAAGLPFSTPRILEIGQVADTWFTRERRLSGHRWQEIFGHLAQPGVG